VRPTQPLKGGFRTDPAEMDYIANFMSANVDARRWAQAREHEGWDALGCADHFFTESRNYPHLWVTLATLASTTKRVRLTSAFANNLFRSPVEFAQASFQMQALSDGRFDAGLGAGWQRDEVVGGGLQYPPAHERAGRYAEAAQIVRQLFDTRACSFHGSYYDIEVPSLGPIQGTPPKLVVALGGRRTIREIAPFADRVELKVISSATRGGTIDLQALAEVTQADLSDLVRRVRAVNETVPLGLFVLCSTSTDSRTRALEESLSNTFVGGFFGSPTKVAESIAGLEALGISSVDISPFADDTFEHLADLLPLSRP